MAIIKCTICGGSVTLAEDKTIGTCEYCGSTMTFPKVSDEVRLQAFNRGNQFRLQGDFEEALKIYEHLVEEDPTDAEAHWCCALCRFGIEYVEDPAAFEWVPTCHRASFDSFLQDVDYLAALENSTGVTKMQYQKAAAKIAEVQKGILATSQNEEPFDVFICYKETDSAGRRTPDSVLAQDIYYQLTDKGYRVFFARVTLENVLGAQYEPYIFAALNSAKVMLCIGTKAEYFNAVWVKNEWSRFKALMKKDRSKLLIPCYRDMDPYNLPEDLKILQSHDMGKIGFLQDLLRGIGKILDKNKVPEPAPAPQAAPAVVTVENSGAGTAPLLKRAFIFLEDGNWKEADEYAEKVLDLDPECGEAYLAKLMATLQAKKRADLGKLNAPFDSGEIYKKVLRFGNKALQEELASYLKAIREKLEGDKKLSIYSKAVAHINSKDPARVRSALSLLREIPGFKDADELLVQYADYYEKFYYEKGKTALETAKSLHMIGFAIENLANATPYRDSEVLLAKAKSIQKEMVLEEMYLSGERAMNKGTEEYLQEACRYFRKCNDYKDAKEKLEYCENRLKEFADLAEEEARRIRMAQIEAENAARKAAKRAAIIKTTVIITVILAAAAALAYYFLAAKPAKTADAYDAAVKLEEDGKVKEAAIAFGKLGDYEDSMKRSLALWDSFVQYQTIAESDAYMGAYFAIGKTGNLNYHFESESTAEDFTKCKEWKNLISVDASKNHLVGLTKDHKVVSVCSTSNLDLYCSECETAEKMENVVQISACGNSIHYLLADGTVNTQKGKEWTDLVQIDSINAHVIGVKADGSVVVDEEDFAAANSWTGIKKVAISCYNAVGLKEDGTVVIIGDNTWNQLDAAKWTDVENIACNYYDIYGQKADGTFLANHTLEIQCTGAVEFRFANGDAVTKPGVILMPDGKVYTGITKSQNNENLLFADIPVPKATKTGNEESETATKGE